MPSIRLRKVTLNLTTQGQSHEAVVWNGNILKKPRAAFGASQKEHLGRRSTQGEFIPNTHAWIPVPDQLNPYLWGVRKASDTALIKCHHIIQL